MNQFLQSNPHNKPPAVYLIILLCLAIHLFAPPAFCASPLSPLTAPPLGERWFSLSMNGERVGFSHVTVIPTADGYRITAEGSAKLLVLGFTREATAFERYDVNRDLSLRSFAVEQVIDKSPLNVIGTVSARSIKLSVETKGGKSEKTLKIKGPVYPSPVANLYPLVQGFAKGRKYKLQILDIEAVKVKDVSIKAIGIETRNGVEALHIQNDLYTFVDNDIWLDKSGNTLEESVRDGLIVNKAESADQASRLLLADVVAKRDLVLDFSLVRVDREIANPASLRRLVLELTGYPSAHSLPEGPGQTATRPVPDRVRFTLAAPLRKPSDSPLSASDLGCYLSATPRINSTHSDIIARQKEILTGSDSLDDSVARLVRWVADHLEDTVLDSQSALEALQLRKGNCQSHARLYVALARAAGIPSRVVSGLVYAPGKGFLYHSWAESYSKGWLAVDPTFAQVPADITHIRLVEGEEADEMALLVSIIGRVKGTIIEFE